MGDRLGVHKGVRVSHGYHEPGRQLVFSDDCKACLHRIKDGVRCFGFMDDHNLALLWDARMNHPNLDGRQRSMLDGHAIQLLKDAVAVANRIGDLT